MSNTLFRPDAGTIAAYLVDAETVELHPTLSDGQRHGDIDYARPSRRRPTSSGSCPRVMSTRTVVPAGDDPGDDPGDD